MIVGQNPQFVAAANGRGFEGRTPSAPGKDDAKQKKKDAELLGK